MLVKLLQGVYKVIVCKELYASGSMFIVLIYYRLRRFGPKFADAVDLALRRYVI